MVGPKSCLFDLAQQEAVQTYAALRVAALARTQESFLAAQRSNAPPMTADCICKLQRLLIKSLVSLETEDSA